MIFLWYNMAFLPTPARLQLAASERGEKACWMQQNSKHYCCYLWYVQNFTQNSPAKTCACRF